MENWFLNIIKNIFARKDEVITDNPKNGLLPSPADFRDYQVKDILGAIDLSPLPKEYRIPYLLPIKYQGSEPSCAGWSGSTVKDEKERREKNDFTGDGSWLYKECKKVDGYNGNGTYFRTVLDRLAKVGIKPLATSAVQGEPAIFRISAYARVDNDFEVLKRAVIEFGAVLAGFYMDNAGWETAYIKPPKKVEFGHAVCVIGFNEDYLIIQNSWGEQWGEKGIGYIAKDYIPYMIEAWCVLSDVPTELLPDIEKPKHFFSTDLYFGIDNANEVKALQDALRWLGCLPKEQQSTGYYGQATMQAVVNFQKRYGINQIGRFGPSSRGKMNELLKNN